VPAETEVTVPALDSSVSEVVVGAAGEYAAAVPGQTARRAKRKNKDRAEARDLANGVDIILLERKHERPKTVLSVEEEEPGKAVLVADGAQDTTYRGAEVAHFMASTEVPFARNLDC
jgi:hypothetical protein